MPLPSDDITGGVLIPSAGRSIYAPRMSVQLNVTDIGVPQVRQIQATNTDTYALDVRPLKARWTSNSYREADELEITASFDEAGLDPRYLRSAEVLFWLDNGGDDFERSIDNLRFIGIIRDVSREFSETSKVVTFRAIDYTTLFIESQLMPQYLPQFSDTLRSAWKKICTYTGHISFTSSTTGTIQSSVCDPDTGEPIIELVAGPNSGVDLDMSIATSVDTRIQSLPAVVAKSGQDSWATWVGICEQLGLITYIDQSVCVVTNATDYYTSSDPPLLVYGRNVLTLTERRDLGQVSGKNVCCRSYDGMTGTVLESFFPKENSPLATTIRQKKIVLPSAKGESRALLTEDFELIDLQIPVTDQAILDQITETIWHERVRAELSGTLTTREMFVDTVATASQGLPNAQPTNGYSLLDLRAGDNITIQIETDSLDNIQSLPAGTPRAYALIQRGYSQDMAQYIVDNMSSIVSLPSQFLVHSTTTELDSQQDHYDVTIEFLNTLDVSGGATVQIPQAPTITGQQLPSFLYDADISFDTTPDQASDISFDTAPDR